MCTATESQEVPVVPDDGSGGASGAIVAWRDDHASPVECMGALRSVSVFDRSEVFAEFIARMWRRIWGRARELARACTA